MGSLRADLRDLKAGGPTIVPTLAASDVPRTYTMIIALSNKLAVFFQPGISVNGKVIFYIRGHSPAFLFSVLGPDSPSFSRTSVEAARSFDISATVPSSLGLLYISIDMPLAILLSHCPQLSFPSVAFGAATAAIEVPHRAVSERRCKLDNSIFMVNKEIPWFDLL